MISTTELDLELFVEPDWDKALDLRESLERLPDDTTVAGMFLASLAEEARKRGVTLPSARARYVPFKFYPVRELVSLLIETCETTLAHYSPRRALRILGRGTPAALLSSTVGKVMLGSARGPLEVLQALAKAYTVNLKPAEVEVVHSGQDYAVVHMRSVPYFLDCHHVGAFEGSLRYAGAEGDVKVHMFGDAEARYLVRWQT